MYAEDQVYLVLYLSLGAEAVEESGESSPEK